MLKRQPEHFIYLSLVCLALVLGATIFAIYQSNQKNREEIYLIRKEVDRKLLLDSVLSAYEEKYRFRLDSLTNNYKIKVDSIQQIVNQLKIEADEIQATMVSTDSVMPLY